MAEIQSLPGVASAPGLSRGAPSTWQKAIEQARPFLTAAEWEQLGRSQPDDIVRDFQNDQVVRGQVSKVQMVLRKIQPLVGAIERFGQSLDILVNASPDILAPLWGTLRAVLLIARDYEDYFSKLLEMLQRISDVLPRYQVYERLFRSHQSLHDALSAVYLEIISFLVRAKKVFSNSSFRVFGRVLWKSFDQTFPRFLAEFRRYGDLVEREAKLAHMVEEAQSRLEISRLTGLVEDQQRAEQSPNLLDIRQWLSARQCHEEKDGIMILPDTCEWIISRPEMLSWIEEEPIQLFWLNGSPGCGKSFLYAKVINFITARGPCVYFLFCGADNERVTVSSLLRSWIFQLAKIFPEALTYLSSSQRSSDNRKATSKEVRKLFFSVLNFLPACYLTVDAIDECQDRSGFYELLPLIPDRFKVFVTSRIIPDFASHLRLAPYRHVSLEITPEMSESDIGRYISRELVNAQHQYEPEVLSHIKERLTACGGMFLWVRLMLRHIQDQTNDEEVMHCLDDLPSSLSEHYDRIIRGINELPKPQRFLAHKVFFWMSVSCRPLEVKELCAMLAVKPSADRAGGYDRSRRITRDPESMILSACGSLITARGERKTLYPIHFTVNEYLKNYVERSQTLSEMTAYYDAIQLKSADSLAAAVCMRYLSLDLVVEKLQERMPSNHFDADNILKPNDAALDCLQYCTNHWFDHVKRVEHPEEELLVIAAELLDTRRPNLEIFWRIYWFSGPDSAQSVICPANFSGIHVAAYFGLTCAVRHLLPIQDPGALDSSGRSALWWAVSMSFQPIVKILIDAGVSPRVPDRFSITALHRAAAVGNTGVFKELLGSHDNGKSAVIDDEAWTPLHWAAARGHLGIIDIIVKLGDTKSTENSEMYGTRVSLTKLGRTPLHLAALNGHGILIRSLAGSRWAYGENTNISDYNGQTALHLAAMHGYLDIVEKLFCSGADPTVLDNSGNSAADKALQMGNKATHGALVSLLSLNPTVMSRSRQHRIAAVTNPAKTRDKVSSTREQESCTSIDSNIGSQLNSRDGLDASITHAYLNCHLLYLELLVVKRGWPRVEDEWGRTLFHYAAVVGRLDVTLLGLEENIEPEYVNHQDRLGRTAMHYAVMGQFHDIVEVLLTSGASLSIADTEGNTSYDLALRDMHPQTVETIVRQCQVPTAQIAEVLGWNEAHCSARDGILQGEYTATMLDQQDFFGRTPVYRALEMGNLNVVKALGGATALPVRDIINLADITSEKHQSVLHYLLDKLSPLSFAAEEEAVQVQAQRIFINAAKRGDVLSLTALLTFGVDIDTRDSSDLNSRDTALQVAIRAKAFDAISYLIDQGADVQAVNSSSNSVLHIACQDGGVETLRIVKCLLRHDLDTNKLGGRGLSYGRFTFSFGHLTMEAPLHILIYRYAVEKSDMLLDTINLLIDHGALLLGVENRSGKTPAHAAVNLSLSYSGRDLEEATIPPWAQPLLDILESRGFGMLVTPIAGDDGFAPIHVAVQAEDVDAVKIELDKGVPVNWKTFRYPQRSPLQIAVKEDHVQVAELLLQYGARLVGNTTHASDKGAALWEGAKSDEMRRLLVTEYKKQGGCEVLGI